MEIAKDVNGVDKALGCLCRRFMTEDGIDWTLNIGNSLKNSYVETG